MRRFWASPSVLYASSALLFHAMRCDVVSADARDDVRGVSNRRHLQPRRALVFLPFVRPSA